MRDWGEDVKLRKQQAEEFVEALLEKHLTPALEKAWEKYKGRAGGLDAQPDGSGVSGSD
jgi:hypothetical protein